MGKALGEGRLSGRKTAEGGDAIPKENRAASVMSLFGGVPLPSRRRSGGRGAAAFPASVPGAFPQGPFGSRPRARNTRPASIKRSLGGAACFFSLKFRRNAKGKEGMGPGRIPAGARFIRPRALAIALGHILLGPNAVL